VISLVGDGDKALAKTTLPYLWTYSIQIPYFKVSITRKHGLILESHTYQQPNCKIQQVKTSCEENVLKPSLPSLKASEKLPYTAALRLITYKYNVHNFKSLFV
jgi:hypothetical protein